MLGIFSCKTKNKEYVGNVTLRNKFPFSPHATSISSYFLYWHPHPPTQLHEPCWATTQQVGATGDHAFRGEDQNVRNRYFLRNPRLNKHNPPARPPTIPHYKTFSLHRVCVCNTKCVQKKCVARQPKGNDATRFCKSVALFQRRARVSSCALLEIKTSSGQNTQYTTTCTFMLTSSWCL
jgi:hypothetical protein